MKKLGVLGLCFIPIIAFGEPSGIDNQNYTISTLGNNSDYGSRITLSGEARFPVIDYTGISLSANLEKFNGKNNYLDSSSKSVGLGVFLRKYDLGLIQAKYNYNESEADSTSISLKNSIETYSLNGAYYINNFDILFTRLEGKPDIGNSIQSSFIGAAYYLNENLRLSGLIGGMDADESYTMYLAYQPEIFKNNISISVSYQDTKSNDTLGFELSYYFDTKVSLIDRVRRN